MSRHFFILYAIVLGPYTETGLNMVTFFSANANQKSKSIYNWYKYLEEEGKKFGYLVNGSKCWLIVKSQELAEEAGRIFREEVNITTEGKRHLGAVIGSKDYKDQYCRDKVQGWRRDITSLAEIAKSQPHAANIALTKSVQI